MKDTDAQNNTTECRPPPCVVRPQFPFHWLRKGRRYEAHRWYGGDNGSWSSGLGLISPAQMAARGFRYWAPARPPKKPTQFVEFVNGK